MITYYEPPDDGDAQLDEVSVAELPSAAWMAAVTLLCAALLLGGVLLSA